jgi:hypothetical protein
MSQIRHNWTFLCLHDTRYDNPSAISALAGFRQRKRLKKLENATKADIQREPTVILGSPISSTSLDAGKEAAQESDHHTNGFDQSTPEDPAEGL